MKTNFEHFLTASVALLLAHIFYVSCTINDRSITKRLLIFALRCKHILVSRHRVARQSNTLKDLLWQRDPYQPLAHLQEQSSCKVPPFSQGTHSATHEDSISYLLYSAKLVIKETHCSWLQWLCIDQDELEQNCSLLKASTVIKWKH